MENRGNDREYVVRMQAAKLRRDIPKCDLHGLRSEQALRNVDAFLDAQIIAGEDSVNVVYGIGEGKLRPPILAHIRKREDVALVEEDERQTSCFVVFK